MAVYIASCSAADEAGEGSMDDWGTTRVGVRLETGITYIGLPNEMELLGKIVASFVRGVGDGEWECNICEA